MFLLCCYDVMFTLETQNIQLEVFFGLRDLFVMSLCRKCELRLSGCENISGPSRNGRALSNLILVGVSNGLRAVRLFLRARAVINFLMRAASTL